MRSLLMSCALAVGAIGFSMATPTQARADDFRSAATITSATTTPAWWNRGWYGGYGGWYGGRAFYPGWSSFGYGYYPYANYGYRSYYYPGVYGGFGYPGYYGGYYGGWGGRGLYRGWGGYYRW